MYINIYITRVKLGYSRRRAFCSVRWIVRDRKKREIQTSIRQTYISSTMVSQLFEEKAKAVNELPTKPSTDELLELYGLYKQATVGDNDKEKPGIFNMKDRYKWEAWEDLKGKSQEDAEKEYIAYVDNLIAKYSS
ncbi:long-chain fatty acid transporter ACB1 [Saccharomyces eubayanus]|nr:ACB1-like protein [Saccharomyces eubayanus]KOG99536.1 ACB1-like protein [Saccharomyces eubayanus]